jgi:multimeric flavodoxin WrbA
MKIVSVLGSPRKKGNTARVLGWVEEELVAAGHEVDHLDIVDRTVNGCVECYTCQKNPTSPAVRRKMRPWRSFNE